MNPALIATLSFALGAGGMWLWMSDKLARERADTKALSESYCRVVYEKRDLAAAHSRCSDSQSVAWGRVHRALEQVTPGANSTVLRMARILKGEA